MKIDKKEIGHRINTIRKNMNYSMEEFGRQIGNAPKGTVNGWEKGLNLPNKARLDLIALMGNISVDELIYGSFENYVSNLIADSTRLRLDETILINFCSYLRKKGLSFRNDIEILKCFQSAFSPFLYESKTYLQYIPFSENENLFIAKTSSPKDSESRYLVHADTKNNILHVLPFFQVNHSNDFYRYSSTLTEEGGHTYYTHDFNKIELTLENSKLIYYGINTKKCEIEITLFQYDKKQDCYKLIGLPPDNLIIKRFCKDLEKEVLYLKQYSQETYS